MVTRSRGLLQLISRLALAPDNRLIPARGRRRVNGPESAPSPTVTDGESQVVPVCLPVQQGVDILVVPR